jgi:hypothetical protein
MTKIPAHAPPVSPEEEEELKFGQVWKEAANAPARPKLTDQADGGRRKSSVQFHTADAEDTIRRESVVQGPRPCAPQRRMSSPPPPTHYQRGVSFDTIDNQDASTESFTLQYKHCDYAATPRSRVFLCGTDAKDYSEYALEWMMDELVDDGDEIVCLRVIEKDTKAASDTPYDREKYRREAKQLLDSVMLKNSQEEKAISIIMELAVGKVQEIFQRMVSRTDLATWPMHILTRPPDTAVRTCRTGCGNPRPKSGGHARPPSRIGLQILSTTVASSGDRRPTYC